MPLRIAFDLDGVLADMESGMGREAALLFGAAEGAGEPAPPAFPSHPALALPAPPALPALATLATRQQHRLSRHVATLENFWETLDECEPGMVARLAAIATDRRWEIIFLTKRPQTRGAPAQLQTQRWLASKGFPLPSVFVVQKSRGAIAASLGLDIVVDDRPENCLDVVVDSKARAILVWRSGMELLPAATKRLGIGVVATLTQCLDMLCKLDTAPDHRSVGDRVMRLFGLREPPPAMPFDSSHLKEIQHAELD